MSKPKDQENCATKQKQAKKKKKMSEENLMASLNKGKMLKKKK